MVDHVHDLIAALGLACPHCEDDPERRPSCRACRAMGTNDETHAATIVDALGHMFARGRLAGLTDAEKVCRISKITARNKGTDATDEAVHAIRKLIEEAAGNG